ncbi:DUF3429 domain-containing protein [Ferrimonas sp.]|uniref:DUF3429 domain-containing protein n=1 Tax=Ferrimonas sp. TaxID=2080861 RepID=UPI003A9202FD
MHIHAYWLGAAGLIPFVALPMMMVLGAISSDTALMGFSQYSAIILSFLGGIHWYQSVIAKARPWQTYLAMIPSILAWVALVGLGPVGALPWLAVGYLLMLVSDRWIEGKPQGYAGLRQGLTAVALIMHLSFWLA